MRADEKNIVFGFGLLGLFLFAIVLFCFVLSCFFRMLRHAALLLTGNCS